VADHVVVPEGVVVAPQEGEDGVELLVGERELQCRVADERVHPPALGERLALDPAEDVTALLVDAEPARCRVEAAALQVEKHLANELRVRPGRTVHGVPDANDAVVGRAAGERGFRVRRG
jgi:hypothetical protein